MSGTLMHETMQKTVGNHPESLIFSPPPAIWLSLVGGAGKK